MSGQWKPVLQIAFTYIGTVVGAGFASGREIYEFFVRYGPQGLAGILIATFLFVWAGIQVMSVARRIQAESYQDVSIYLFGKTLGSVFNGLLLTVLLGTSSVMLAATGALVRENFQLPAQLGIWSTLLFVFFITIRGLPAIHSVNSLFVPLLIGFMALVFWHAAPWAEHSDIPVISSAQPWSGLVAPISYVALNTALTQSVLVPIGRACRDPRILVWGGVLGGGGIGLLLILAYLAMTAQPAVVQVADMPMIALLSGMGKSITLLFALVVWIEILSSLIANVYGLAQQTKQWLSLQMPVVTLLILACCYLVSFLGFKTLLALLYPLFGKMVAFFLGMLLIRQFKP